MTATIPTVSITKLHIYEACPYRAKLAWVDKIPDTQPRKAADRGTAIHQMAEDYVRGELKQMPIELKNFATEFEALKQFYKNGQISLEGEWGFDKDWRPTEYRKAWLRVKADAVCFAGPQNTVVVDYKSGKRFGNELKHAEQLQVYAIATLIRKPTINLINAELWYLDIDDLAHMQVKETMLKKYIQAFDRRFKKMSSDTEFKPNPNIVSCKWCPYHPSRQGDCGFGV